VAEINPKESFLFKKQENIKNTFSADTIKVNAWTRGNLIFEVTPMSEVFNELERWYGTQFNIKNKSIYNQYLSANFKNESLIQVMEIIKFCTKAEYKIEKDNSVIVY
jgi:Fe2+-dicitrate sensor, membrane component